MVPLGLSNHRLSRVISWESLAVIMLDMRRFGRARLPPNPRGTNSGPCARLQARWDSTVRSHTSCLQDLAKHSHQRTLSVQRATACITILPCVLIPHPSSTGVVTHGASLMAAL